MRYAIRLIWLALIPILLYAQGVVHPRRILQAGATDGQVLSWNNTNGVWEPADAGGVGTDSIGTDELDDGADTATSGHYVRVDTVDQAGFEYRSPAEVLSDIGAAASSHNHAASEVTSGTFADARISESSVTQHQAALSIAISQLTGGQLGLSLGGTGADLSATGPGFLKQASGGANVTVATIADSDVPDTITIDNAATADALTNNPTDCTSNQFANAIAADGDLTCAAISDADVPDTITVSNYLLLAGGTMTGQIVADNLGIELTESDTNPTCNAGNYSIYADLSDARVAFCDNGSVKTIGIQDDETVAGAGMTESTETLNVIAADTSLTVNADDIQVRLKTVAEDGLSTTSAVSGLEVQTGLTLIQGCADGQILKWEEDTDTWDCADDGGSGADSHPIADNIAVLKDDLDNSKQIKFQLSGITTSTTRTLTVPDADFTIEQDTHASDHQHGGADEVGDATGGTANVIVKAESDGTIDINFLDTEVLLESDVGTGLSVTSNTIDFAPEEVGAVTFLDNADRCWTFDVAAAGTNPIICFDDGTFGFSTTGSTFVPDDIWHLLSDGADEGMVIESDQDGSAGAHLEFFHDSASPAANDFLGFVRVFGNDSGANKTQFGGFSFKAEDPTNTSEYGEFRLDLMVNGSLTNVIETEDGAWMFKDTGTQPTCDSSHRGAVWVENGASGVADAVEVCAKDIDDTYQWNPMHTGSVKEFIAAACQNGTAASGFQPASSVPTAACDSGSNTNYAYLEFDDSAIERVDDHITLPDGYSGLDVTLWWKAAATSGNVRWLFRGVCVDEGETGDPALSDLGAVTDAAQGTANQWNRALIHGLTPSGCAARETLHFEIARVGTDGANDTMTGDAHLIKAIIRFN